MSGKKTPNGSFKGKTKASAGNVKQTSATATTFISFFKRHGKWVYPLFIAVAVYLFLDVSLGNGFTNWDDNDYVTDNNLIKDISAKGIQRIFDINTVVQGNYHPLTMLSLALDYNQSGLDPYMYHLSSLLYHILCTLLVFWFVALLFKNNTAAFIAALLFGLHPMHMESVAWVSGRKDVVYGFFYVAALIAYVYYLRSAGFKKALSLTLVLAAFCLSLLSKPSAVVLPLSLLLLDFYEKRKLSVWLFLEKLPFFALSLVFGLKSVTEQNNYGAVRFDEFNYTVFDRLALGGHALFAYLWKALAPANLRCFYQYPAEVEWFSLILVLLLTALIVLYGRKNRYLVFGMLFFLFNIGLLLQFIPVGAAIIAERYTYIPYIGLFAAAGVFISGIADSKNKALVFTVIICTATYIGFLGQLAAERSRVWRDNISLWNDEIEKEPRFYGSYNNLGYYYYQMYDTCRNAAVKRVYFDSSYYLTSKAIEINKDLPVPYITLGELERFAGNFDKAKAYYFKGMSIEKQNKEYAKAKANIGLGIIYGMNNRLDSAGHYLRAALRLAPRNPDVHNNLGNFFALSGKTDSSFYHYSQSIKLDSSVYTPYLNRGRVHQQLKNHQAALKDFETALRIRPDLGEIFYTRSATYYAMGNKTAALKDAEKAIALGYGNADPNYLNTLKQ